MRFKLLTIVTTIVGLMLFAYIVLWGSPPQASNRLVIKTGISDWSIPNERTICGKTIWSQFADYPNETIKLYYCIFWGSFLVDKRVMSWEDETGSFTSRSLALNDLMKRAQNSESIFRFSFENEHFRVTFSIPNLEDETQKYPDLREAWKNGELHQIIEEW